MTNGASSLTWLLVALTISACATLGGASAPENDPELRLQQGVDALEANDFDVAHTELSWVYTHCPSSRQGMDALLLLATAELDPRNSSRRLDVGAALVGAYLATPGISAERRQLGESIYLLALELGALPPLGVSIEPPGDPGNSGLTSRCIPAEPRQVIALPVGRRAEQLADTVLPDAVTAEDTLAIAGADTLAPGAEDPMLGSLLPPLPGESVPERLAALAAVRDSLEVELAELRGQVDSLEQRVASQEEELERIRRTIRP